MSYTCNINGISLIYLYDFDTSKTSISYNNYNILNKSDFLTKYELSNIFITSNNYGSLNTLSDDGFTLFQDVNCNTYNNRRIYNRN